MSEISCKKPDPNITVSITPDGAPDTCSIPEEYRNAYAQMQLLKSNPQAFLMNHFRLVRPQAEHSAFADLFRQYLCSEAIGDIAGHYSDEASVKAVQLGMERLLSYPSTALNPGFFHVPYAMMNEQERHDLDDYLQKQKEIAEKYHNALPFFSPTEFYYKHGLIYIDSPEITGRIANGTALDCGSFDGGSMMVMADYNPERIVGFEPSKANIEQCRKNLDAAGITVPYNIEHACVGNCDGFVSFNDRESSMASLAGNHTPGTGQVRMFKLDTYCRENNIKRVSWLKADLEGAALEMVKGAEEIIRRDRPLLTIGIYHSPDEFFGIPKLLHSWIPEYKFMLRRCQCLPMVCYNELTLIAYCE